MKRFIINFSVVFGTLFLVGIVKVPWEVQIEKEMREDNILPPKIDLVDRNSVGQAGYAAALGGFRDVLASYFYLKAHNLHVERDWFEMERTLNTVVTLQPRSEHFWEMAGYQLAYNTFSLVNGNSKIEPIERARLAREYIEKGDSFWERGLRVLPANYTLSMSRARLYRDHFRLPDFEKAREALEVLLKEGDVKGDKFIQAWGKYIYTLTSLNGNEVQVYKELYNLYNTVSIGKRVPTQRVMLYVLQDLILLAPEKRIPEEELLFNMEVLEEMMSLYSFPAKVEASPPAALSQEYAKLVKEFAGAPPEGRTDAKRAKITFLEATLDLSQENRVPEDIIYRSEEHKSYIRGMQTYRDLVLAAADDPSKAYRELKSKYLDGGISKSEQDVLALIQLVYEDKLIGEDLLPLEKLTYSDEMKYKHLKIYWNARNGMTQNIFRYNHDKLEIMPVGNLVSQLMILEESFNIPEEQRIKIQDIYTEKPY